MSDHATFCRYGVEWPDAANLHILAYNHVNWPNYSTNHPMPPRSTTLNDQFRGAVHREAISDQITNRILLMIREHQLRPGDKLPPERELSRLMGVSRATVREALRSLAMMNVVELRHGSGTYITSLEPQLLVENFALVFTLTDHSFLQLVQARKVIEPGATAMAAERITPDELSVLADVLKRSRNCLHDDPASFPQLDIEFHTRIAEFSGNVLLARIMQAITQMSIASSQRTAVTDVGYSPQRIERAIRKHEDVFNALIDHDSQQAHARMLAHLIEVEDTLRGAYPD